VKICKVLLVCAFSLVITNAPVASYAEAASPPHPTNSKAVLSEKAAPATRSITFAEKTTPRIGTNELPLVVRSLEQPGEAAERIEARRYGTLELANQRAMLYLTLLMAVVAIAQLAFFAWQLQLMRKSVEDAGAAASAAASAARSADLNARAAIGIELPILRVTPPELLSTSKLIADNGPYGGMVNDRSPTKYSAVGNLELRNDGRTPAFLSEISVGWNVATTLPERPTYRRTDRLGHASIVRPGDTFMCHELHYGIELSDEELNSLRAGTTWLWFFGMIEYRDFLDDRRLAKFCWRFANRNVGTKFYFFASDGNPPERYTGAGRMFVAQMTD
jgi:hypothetical protein